MKKFIIVAMCIVLSFQLLSCSQSSGTTPSKDKVGNPYLDLPSYELDVPDVNLSFKEPIFVITYSASLVKNNSVGNDWERGLKYNGETISSGSRITHDPQTSLSLTAFAIEDDSYDDKGSANVTFDCLEIGQKKTKQVSVIVRENKGRYKGNTAKWTFDITVERIS